jgi:hypothetical protein
MKRLLFLVGCTMGCWLLATAQNIGVNTNTPLGTLDINGDMVMRNGALSLSNGSNNDINTTTARYSYYIISGPSTVFDITGLNGGVDGRMITLYNSTAFLMNIKHDNPLSAAGNRINTGTGVDFVLSSYSSVTFRYSTASSFWHIVSSHNEWTTGSSSFWAASGNDIGNTNTGNVGIGTNSPQHARLEINGNVGATVAMFGADKFGVGISADNPEIGFNYFYNGGTKTIKAGYGANLGMDPSNGNMYIGNFSGNQSVANFGAISGYQYVMTITQGGKVGIKTTSPSTELDINGQGRITGTPLSSPGLFGNLTSGGTLFIRNNSDSKGLNIDGTKIQAIQANTISSGSFGIPLLLNPYGGNVGIGTLDPQTYKLAVNGSIRAKEVRVNTGWADFVFETGYQLIPLAEVEAFIRQHKHLPDIPPAAELQKEGVDLSAMQTKMMAKIEELTLYLIEANKNISLLQQRLSSLEKQPANR